MNMYLDSTPITVEELRQKFYEIDELDVIELVMVGLDGELWFEVHSYGVQF